MEDKEKRCTIQDLYKKQMVIEAMLIQILQRLPIGDTSDILKDMYEPDKNSPFWDDEKQAYSMKSYRESHPREKGDT